MKNQQFSDRRFGNGRLAKAVFAGAVGCLGVNLAMAQSPGAIIENQNKGLSLPEVRKPRPAPPVEISNTPEPAKPLASDTEKKFAVQEYSIEWSGMFPPEVREETLKAVPLRAGEYSVSSLREHVLEIAKYLRARGYVAAKAWVPPQQIANGKTQVRVDVGAIGKISFDAGKLSPDARVDGQVPLEMREKMDQALRSVLCAGQASSPCQLMPIERASLERALLVAGDAVNAKLYGVLNPNGSSAWLEVSPELLPSREFEVGLDNSGSKATGRGVLKSRATFRNLAQMGDVLSLVGSTSRDWGSANFQLDYGMPLTPSGWRVGATLAKTRYELGGDFQLLDAKGDSEIVGVYARYPVYRSILSQVDFRADLEHANLKNSFLGDTLREGQDSLRATLSGSHYDYLLGTGASSNWAGSVVYSDTRAKGAVSSQFDSLGGAWRLIGSVQRTQELGSGFRASASLVAQMASRSLARTNRLFIGGPDAVRAYPIGESGGDSAAVGRLQVGWMGQVPWLARDDWRWGVGVFHDRGWAKLHANQLALSTSSSEVKAGSGLEFTLIKVNQLLLRAYVARASTGVSAQDGKRSRLGISATVAF